MIHSTSFVALATLAILLQYYYFAMRAGSARGKDKVIAPATTGDHHYECRLRVQMNTLEQMVVILPAMWLCTHYFRADVAAIGGIVFFIARAAYSAGYPDKRAAGMLLTMLSNVVLIGCSAYGAIASFF